MSDRRDLLLLVSILLYGFEHGEQVLLRPLPG